MVYESRLELARLILADFDLSVHVIVAQPFQIEGEHHGRTRRHVPDYLFVDRDEAATVVNVKPSERLKRPKVADSLRWAHGLFESVGWQTETWSGEDATVLLNVRFLAGYRRSGLVGADVIASVASVAAGATVGDAEAQLTEQWPSPVVRPAIMHLLWRGELRTDLSVPLSLTSRLVAV